MYDFKGLCKVKLLVRAIVSSIANAEKFTLSFERIMSWLDPLMYEEVLHKPTLEHMCVHGIHSSSKLCDFLDFSEVAFGFTSQKSSSDHLKLTLFNISTLQIS